MYRGSRSISTQNCLVTPTIIESNDVQKNIFNVASVDFRLDKGHYTEIRRKSQQRMDEGTNYAKNCMVETIPDTAMQPTTAERISRMVLTEEFQPLSKSRRTIFLPSRIFPNTDRRITMEESNTIFESLHEITGRVCDKNSEADRKELRDALNSVLEETRRYTRTRICQPKEVEACRHWEWKTNGRLVESNDDIDAVLSSTWEANKATMINQCHTLMHGLYQSKSAIGWFSEGLQHFLNLKKIKLYKTDAHGNKKILEENNVGRLLSFVKQARTKSNRDRNATLKRFQGIQIFSGKRAKFAKDHTNRKPVNKFDGGCHGYYIETESRPQNAKKTLASLLSEGHTEEELVEIMRQIKKERSTSIPATVHVNHETFQMEVGLPTTAMGLPTMAAGLQTMATGQELDDISINLQLDDNDIVMGTPLSTKLIKENQKSTGDDFSPRRNNDEESSKENTETEHSEPSVVSPNNVRQKNMMTLQEKLKPKEIKKKKRNKKVTKTNEATTQERRRSTRNSPTNEDQREKDLEDANNKKTPARRVLQV